MPVRLRTIEERLQCYVEVPCPMMGTPCWAWTRGKVYGYGSMWTGKTTARAHIVSYEFHVGPLGDGMEIDHRCGNRSCINPDHLRAVTHAENLQNVGVRSDSRSGIRGVYFGQGYWHAQVKVNGVAHRRAFKTRELAAKAVVEMRRELMPFSERDKAAHR